MMGHRERLRGGDEWDALTGWRRVLFWKPGALRWIKRQFWKRSRKRAKQQTIQEVLEATHAAGGYHWDDVEDPDEYIREMRG